MRSSVVYSSDLRLKHVWVFPQIPPFLCDMCHRHMVGVDAIIAAIIMSVFEGEKCWLSMSCHPICMLCHDLANKLPAVVAHCQMLEIDTEIGSPAFQRMEKIKELALQMSEMLHVRECDLQKTVTEQTRESNLIA